MENNKKNQTTAHTHAYTRKLELIVFSFQAESGNMINNIIE